MRSDERSTGAKSLRGVLTALLLLAAAGTANADVSVFAAELDNTMFGPGVTSCPPDPTRCSNGIGPHIIIDDTNGGRRGLIQFGVDGTPQSGVAIPAGSTVTSVELTIHMSITSGSVPGELAIKPLAQSWGEGTSNSGGEGMAGMGAQATVGDATWIRRFFDTISWNHVGGTCRPNTSCTTAASSAIEDVQFGAPNFITWGSTAAMVSDVQGWLDVPSTNNGWIIMTLALPARLDSRENSVPGLRPTLTVTYTPPPPPMPTIQRSPSSFSRNVVFGMNLSSDSFTVRNSGTGTLNYTISDNVGFITSLAPSSGSSTGELDSIDVNYDTTGLEVGTHIGFITISSNDPGVTNSPQTILVSVTVASNLANDECATPTVIASLPFADSIDTAGASDDASDPLPPCGTGPDGATVWYSVTRPTTETLVASTAGSSYDTVLSVWDPSGGCRELVNIDCNDNAEGQEGSTSELQFSATGGSEFLIMVGDRNLGSGGDLEFSLVPEPARYAMLIAALATLGATRRARRSRS